MPTAAEVLKRAIGLQQAGKFPEAESICRQVLEQHPKQPDALHLLGMLAHHQGKHDVAVEHIGRAIAVRASNPVYHHNLGLIHLRCGRFSESVDCFRRAIRLKPDLAEAHCSQGVALKELGNLPAAMDSYRQAIAIKPEHSDAHANLGNALFETGDTKGAIQSCRESIRINPRSTVGHFNLAIALKANGRLDEAALHYRKAIEINPCFTVAYTNLANIRLEQHQFTEAISIYRRAVEINPNYAEGHFNLAAALAMIGKDSEAAESYGQAIRIRPDYKEAYGNLGSIFKKLGRLDDAVTACQKAVELEPSSADRHYNLGNVYADLGELDDARSAYRQAVRLRPKSWCWKVRLASLCPVVFESSDAIDEFRESLSQQLDALREHKGPFDLDELGRCGCEPSFNLPFQGRNDRTLKAKYGTLFQERITRYAPCFSDGPPRVGMLVTDGHERLFIRQMAGSINRFGRGRLKVSIICSLAGRALIEPQITHPDVDYLVIASSFTQAVETVRSAHFDLLYYREIGTDSTNYFLPFFRPAPIQCTTWGIQVTSGIPAMDYYVSSNLLEPADAARHYSERLILQSTLLTYQRRRDPPARMKGRSVFGFGADDHLYLCAQQLGKFHPDFDEVLGELLRRDAAGKLVITSGKSRHLAELLRQRFQRRLPDLTDRIVFLPPLEQNDYHSLIMNADVMLDPIYFNGVNTTYDGLSFGTPIVTLPWEYQRGRYTYGCYRQMNLMDCVASNVSNYVDVALRLGCDRDFRQDVSERIRNRGDAIFEDTAVPRELEEFLISTIETARAQRS